MKIHKTALRLPKDLHELILDAASKSGISMNAEIVTRLRESFKQKKESTNNIEKITEEEVRKIAREIYKELSERSEI